MSLFSRLTGQDAAKRRREEHSIQQYGAGNDPGDQYAKALNFEQKGGGWQDAFNQTAGAYLNQAMPKFRQQLQLTREDAIRRGVSTGDLGTSEEGNLTSQFQQNIADAFGSMAMQGYENQRNRYLDLLTGQLDRDQNEKNSNRNFWSGLLGGAMQGGSTIAAAALM